MRGILEIDGKIFTNNIKLIRSFIGNHIQFISVVKTNAYGLGTVNIVKLIDNYVNMFAVANVDEALEISQITKKSILILSTALPTERQNIVKNNFIPVISSTDEAYSYDYIAKRYNKNLAVHIGIDTGMGREGVWFENFDHTFAKILQLKNINVTGLMTHYSSINSDNNYTYLQKSRFENIVHKYSNLNLTIHSCSSFGIDKFIGKYDTAVRIGVLPFGISELNMQHMLKILSLQPAIALKSWITAIKDLPKNTPIGYNLTYILQRNSTIAIGAIGYGDGIPVNLSNCGKVLINGKLCKIIGRISMDQLMIDITDIAESAKVGDEIVFFGNQNGQTITVNEYISNSNMLLRETTQRLSKRIELKII